MRWRLVSGGGARWTAPALALLLSVSHLACGRLNYEAQSDPDAGRDAEGGAGLRRDPSFGDGGVVELPPPTVDPLQFTTRGVVEDRDGTILVVGSARVGAEESDLLVARLTAEGALDPSFGEGGLALTDVSSNDMGHGLVVRDDAIVACGSTAEDVVESTRSVAIRLSRSGALDTAWGAGGIAEVDRAPAQEVSNGCMATPDGSVLLGGQAQWLEPTNWDLQAAMLDAGGALTPSFGEAGVTHVDFDEADEFGSLIRGASDSIYLAGSAFLRDGSGHNCAVVRLRADGTLDPSFGAQGRVALDVAGLENRCFGLAIGAGGELTAVGSVRGAGGTDMAVFRLDPSGAPNPSFGDGGVLTVDLGCDTGLLRAAEVLPDGRVAVAGFCVRAGETDMVLMIVSSAGAVDRTMELDLGGRDGIGSIALDARGRLLVIGGTDQGGTSRLFVMRVLID